MPLITPEPKANVPRIRELPVDAIERNAQKIRDPILRLQYLRRATARRAPGQPNLGMRAALLLVAATVTLRSDANPRRQPFPQPARPRAVPSAAIANVWLVEENKDFEVYSNGLRIETRLAVSNKPRSYTLIHRAGMRFGPRRSRPAGIVFHTTESDQAPFEAEQTRRLQRIGQELLLYIRGKRAYHYVIDRFGRVHRVVVETDDANHAGNSVWADAQWAYLDLNNSFLGVAFEAAMQTDQPPINPAQVHAARVLTEMLRSKYNLAAEDCVTHAQVSVNPDNMHIGWHADWGKGFPFGEIGLPQNYGLALPAMYLYGFEYDPVYRGATGPELWQGLALAEEQMRRDAVDRRVAAGEYRSLLRKQYRDQIAALHQGSADQEN